MIVADAEDLPFAEGSFDYIIASHVLEHVDKPEKFLGELARVGKRGYIETPSEISELMIDKPYHLWLVNQLDGKLFLKRKVRTGDFGKLFARLIDSEEHFNKFSARYRSLFFVSHEWEGGIDFEITDQNSYPFDYNSVEAVDSLLAKAQEAYEVERSFLIKMKRSVDKRVVKIDKLLSRKRTQKRPIEEILVCPACKGGVEWHSEKVVCKGCGIDYELKDGIPRMLIPE